MKILLGAPLTSVSESSDSIFLKYNQKAKDYASSKNFIPRFGVSGEDYSPSPKQPMALYEYYNFQPKPKQTAFVKQANTPQLDKPVQMVGFPVSNPYSLSTVSSPELNVPYDEDCYMGRHKKKGWICGNCRNFNYESKNLKRQAKVQ